MDNCPFRIGIEDTNNDAWPSRTSSQLRNEVKSTPTSESRKRALDDDATVPLQKKAKTDESISRLDLPPRDSKSSTSRNRDAPKEKPNHKEAKDGRALTPSGTTNGRLQVSGDKDLSSPRSTIMVNGGRSRAGSSSSTPRKVDKADTSKPIIPPLISRDLPSDVEEAMDGSQKRPAGKAPVKGPKSGGHSRNASSTKAQIPDLMSPIHIEFDYDPDKPSKRPQDKVKAKPPKSGSRPPNRITKPGIEIPGLISKRLPDCVEAEFARLEKAGALSQRSSLGSTADSPASAKKVKALTERKEEQEETRPRSRIVTLKYKKALRSRVSAILALPSKSIKEALRKERSASVERTPPARKRPLPGPEPILEVPSKRPRPSADILPPIPPKPAAPTTPLKNSATSMKRVLSNNSQVNTPGDSTGHTPGGGGVERPPTSSENQDPALVAKIQAQLNRHQKYQRLGTKLKHTKDAILRSQQKLTLADEKRVVALHFEMILCYMIAFKSLNQSYALKSRPHDFLPWDSLLPHFIELRARCRPSRPLFVLAVQIHAICLEEITQAFTTLDERTAAAQFGKWARQARKRTATWTEARALQEDTLEEKMKANLGPWTTSDDAVAAALLIIRRWAEKENVDWRPELEMPVNANGV